MSHLIRIRFLQEGLPPIDTTIHEGLFQGMPPRRHRGRACRALESASILSGDDKSIARKAAFLRGNATQDPNQLIFMDCSCGEPFGSLDPFPECADWIHDESLGGWRGVCRGPSAPIEASLFAFWLLQALSVASKPDGAPSSGDSHLANGRKAPVAAHPDLLWEWDQCSEPRLALLCAGHALALDPSDATLLGEVGRLSHPALAEAFARIAPSRYALLCGCDAALGSLLARNELESATAAGRARVGIPRL